MEPDLYQMTAIKVALRAYAKHGMKINRHWTPSRMMAQAERLCGCKFKRGAYLEAASVLEKVAEKRKKEIEERAAVERALGHSRDSLSDQFGQAL
jgi:uncharacterized membrane protein